MQSKNGSNALSGSIWNRLKENGWKYMCGPEPVSKVYVLNDRQRRQERNMGFISSPISTNHYRRECTW